MVVLDTNVVVSGVFFRGTPHTIMNAWSEGHFELAATSTILEEYRRVIVEMSDRLDAPESLRMIAALFAHSVFVDEPADPVPICRDPDGDKFLACAAAVDAIPISGDKDLLAVNGALGVAVLTPRAFLTRLDRRA